VIGYGVCAVGWVAVVVGLVLMFGVPALVAGGLVTVVVGALVDFEPEPKGPLNGKRR
jgi:hypothetical protein